MRDIKPIRGRVTVRVLDAESARLFNAAGRIRRLRVDAMIAAAAITANAVLATDNLEDFKVFSSFGLRLTHR